jgi:spore coat protein A
MFTRRQFLVRGAAVGAGLVTVNGLGWSRLLAQAATMQTPLPGSAIPRFLVPLPLLEDAGGSIETITAGSDPILLTMSEFLATMLPPGFIDGYLGTWAWGYRFQDAPDSAAGEAAETFIGPVIVAARGTPTAVTWRNGLPGAADETQVRAWYEATDQTLHWADPLGDGMTTGNKAHYQGAVPAVPHLHGGEVPPEVDGGPDAWFTADGAHVGHAYYSRDGLAPKNYAVYRYPNSQEAAPLWFHDHVLGVTRLNVYAGLAGAYVLTDPDLALPPGLHPVGLQQGASGPLDYVIPLVLQDRMFDTQGQLYFPNVGVNSDEHPYWIPEFVGDTIVVNGASWPYLNVEPRRYRFLLFNGSNARAYELFFTNPKTKRDGPALWQIASDGGYLDAPVPIDPNAPGGRLQKLLLMPGERADVIVDFASFAGQTLLLRNIGRTPYPKGTPPHGATVGQIMQVRVASTSRYAPDLSYDPAAGTPLRPPLVRLAKAGAPTVSIDATRQLTLNEVIGPGGPLEILVNNTKWSGLREDGTARDDFTRYDDQQEYLSELPDEGTTELWEFVNLTADAHPMHLHLTQFQLVNRQRFNQNKYAGMYAAAFPAGVYMPGYGPPLTYDSGSKLGGNPDIAPYLQGPARPPATNETGWKDTVVAYPGEVTRIAVRFAPQETPAGQAGTFPFDPDGHGYVWHCHIIDHEDNEMMRPYRVTPTPGANRSYQQGVDF